MYGPSETLPNWFWIIYYLFLLTTLGVAIFSVIRKKVKFMSVIVILFVVAIPIVTFLNGIGREVEQNEFEYLVSQLNQGALWSIFTIIGYIFIFVWWILIFIKSKK